MVWPHTQKKFLIFQLPISTIYILYILWNDRVGWVYQLPLEQKACPKSQGQWERTSLPLTIYLYLSAYTENSGHSHNTSICFLRYGLFTAVANGNWLPAGWNLQLSERSKSLLCLTCAVPPYSFTACASVTLWGTCLLSSPVCVAV